MKRTGVPKAKNIHLSTPLNSPVNTLYVYSVCLLVEGAVWKWRIKFVQKLCGSLFYFAFLESWFRHECAD